MALYKGAASEAGRALQLKKKREKALEELEHRKRKIEEELKLSDIENKFAAHYDAVEQQLKSSTIGLVTLDEMKAKQEDVVKERERQLAQKQHEKELQRQKEMREKQEAKERQKRQIASLSFRMDEDDEEEDEEDGEKDNSESYLSNTDESLPPQKKICKNPDVDTSFLPDREREEEERKLREELRQRIFTNKKNYAFHIIITITFVSVSFEFVLHMDFCSSLKSKCLEVLRKEFHELRAVTGDQLMYVKEDLIIPHHYTFYDFIVTKARGKSGPLFSFDVHDDVRLVNDASVEKDESHAGKVLLRSWYERNKHIFPASRWEPYDPTKNYEKYTISDRKKFSVDDFI
ncbi:UNVERIFIED_CONTAM: Protein FAM50-like protein [Trichonephila clavipes]